MGNKINKKIEDWEKGIIKDRICLAYFRKWQNCHSSCQWYRENSFCPNGIAKDLMEEICQREKAKNRQKFIEILERLKLEFDVNVCECGEKWNETDAADIVNEAIKQLKDE